MLLLHWSTGRSVGRCHHFGEWKDEKKKTRKKKAAPKRNAISKGWRLFNIIDYYCIFFFFFKCCDRLYIFEIKDSTWKNLLKMRFHRRLCCGRVFLFFNWISLCLNRYIISAIFFVIRCALVTRKDFFLTVGRRIEWAAVFFFLGWYMHIRMESAATGIIFDCVKHERLCVTMAGFFFRLGICLKLRVYLPGGDLGWYSDTIVYVQCSTYGIYWRFVFLRYSFIKGVKEGLHYWTGLRGAQRP